MSKLTEEQKAKWKRILNDPTETLTQEELLQRVGMKSKMITTKLEEELKKNPEIMKHKAFLSLLLSALDELTAEASLINNPTLKEKVDKLIKGVTGIRNSLLAVQ